MELCRGLLKEGNKLLANKIDKVNSDLSARIDAVNARLDTVITAIFKRDVA